MHISEGILNWPVLAAGAGAAAAGVAIGFKKMDHESIPKTAILSAAFFVASLIHVPFGVTSVHLILNGIVGLILGWAAFPAILVALILQAVFFQFGGITTLGVNTVVMAGPAVILYYACRNLVVKKGPVGMIASFACGFFGVFLSGLFLALILIFSNEKFFSAAALILGAHLPVMIIEGIVTLFCVRFLLVVQPELLHPTEKRRNDS